MAAGAFATTKTLKIDPQNTGHSSLILEDTDFREEYEDVGVVAVDETLPKNTSIDFALIDVEDYQVEALIGMKRILERSPSSVLLIEWSGENIQKDANTKVIALELLQWLKEKRFRPLLIL